MLTHPCCASPFALIKRAQKSYSGIAISTLAAIIGACSFLAACGSGMTKSTPPPALSMSLASTSHPLVAQAQITSGCAGQVMVEFGPDTSYGRNTTSYAIDSSNPLTVQVAGMRASTTYHMRVQRQCGGATDAGADSTFTTGALPATPFPALQVSRPASSPSVAENPGIELVDTIAAASGQMQAFFTDRDANPIWYYDVGPNAAPYVFKPLPNGNLIFEITSGTLSDTILREVDLAGNTIREMDVSQLVQKTQAAGYDFIPNNLHHEVLPLTNGHVIILVNCTKPFTDLPGYPGTTQVIGDQIIDLDENWNPVWSWNSFDHLDVTRHLNGLPDWTHSNALVYTPQDGNLLLSIRHQSWVIKIDYNNGTGTGNVLWRLGYEGDFALAQGDDPTNWFSFQHFPSLVSQNGSQITLAVWDNGDSRFTDTTDTATCGTAGAPACYSRATVFQLDESAMSANLLWDNIPGYYSLWGGSINQLANGNIEFDANALNVPPVPNVVSEVQEVTQTATPHLVWKMDIPTPMFAYRAYRVPSLYPGVTWQY